MEYSFHLLSLFQSIYYSTNDRKDLVVYYSWLVYSLLFISAFGFAQVEKQVGTFSKVTAFDKIDVYLIKSTENKVVLKG